MINPAHTNPTVRTKEFRYPSPGSQPVYKAPKGEASDLSNNYYFKRDGRKSSPETIQVSKQQLLAAGNVKEEPEHMTPPPIRVYKYIVSPDQPPHVKTEYFPVINYK